MPVLEIKNFKQYGCGKSCNPALRIQSLSNMVEITLRIENCIWFGL